MMPNLQRLAPGYEQFTREQLHDALLALMNLAEHLHSRDGGAGANGAFPFVDLLQSEIGGETAEVLTRIAREMWTPSAYGDEWGEVGKRVFGE